MKKIKPLKNVFYSAGIVLSLSLIAAGAAAAAPDKPPCSASAESRQLDFWLGDWAVAAPGGTKTSASKVFLELDQCLLVESWDGGRGHTGKNMFAYSADDKSWHGLFADNEGRVHVFEGKVSAGAAEFTGPSRSETGAAVLNRIRVIRINADQVEQTWEKSIDNGATWSVVFRGVYSRKKS
jgi:hypothetical protein